MTNQEWEQIETDFREWHNQQDWSPNIRHVLFWWKQRLTVDAPNSSISVTECKNYEPNYNAGVQCKWCGKGKYTHV